MALGKWWERALVEEPSEGWWAYGDVGKGVVEEQAREWHWANG
jgi:hypothetical protein